MFWCSKFLEHTFYRLRNKPVCIIQHFPWDCSESNMIFTLLLKILYCLPDEYLNNLRMLFWRETLLEWNVLYHENLLQKRGRQSKQAEKKGPWDVLAYSNTKINCLSHVWSDIKKLCYSSVRFRVRIINLWVWNHSFGDCSLQSFVNTGVVQWPDSLILWFSQYPQFSPKGPEQLSRLKNLQSTILYPGMFGVVFMAHEKLRILLFQPFTPTIHFLFLVLLPGKLQDLSSAHGQLIQQRGWSWNHLHILTEVYVALKSQRIKNNVKLLKPILLESQVPKATWTYPVHVFND